LKSVEAHQRLQVLFDGSPVAIGFCLDGVLLDANPAYARLFGHDDLAELRGQSILGQIAPSHRARIVELLGRRARGDAGPYRYETRGLRKDGTEFPFEITTAPVVVADTPMLIAFISDVSERERVVEALKASEERFRTLASAAREGVVVHGDGKILLANEAAATMYGFDDPGAMIGASVMDLTAPEYRDRVAGRVQRADESSYEGMACRRDGSTFHAEVHGKTLSHQGRAARVTIIRDITERMRSEAEQSALAERMRQAQKLESLGMLAGGVAHDFNNILTIISNGVALAKRQPGLTPTSTAHLESIAHAAARAADLCRQMLAYAGKAGIARESVDLSALVDEMSSMLEVSVATKATLVRDLAPGLPPLLGDATQVRQVVMNLVLNAVEACAAGGTVRIATGVGFYDAAVLSRSAAGGEPRAGSYVWLQVSDDGIGMDAPTVAQMFDPFFTTKFVGRGLGMAAVLGIVRGHAGAIDVQSAPGKGTTVLVLFLASEARPSRALATSAGLARGQGLVLVVDDEKNVRITTELLLRDLGFEVIVARDGFEAIEVLRAQPGRVHAVLLDLTMPRMDGVQTMRALRKIAPRVPVVLASGYGAAGLEGSLDAQAGGPPDAVLAKPYSAEELMETLQRVMG
jgi:two-component system cell cycle sensor histidine kinase/response regulator CckA